MQQEQNRSSRLEARISPAGLAVVKRAAQIEGRTVSDFVVAAAQAAANQTIEKTHLIQLSAQEQERFVELLLNPPAPTAAMERAKQAHASLIRSPE